MLFLNIWPQPTTMQGHLIMLSSSSNTLQVCHQETLLMVERLTISGSSLTLRWGHLSSTISRSSLRTLLSTTTGSQNRTTSFGLPSEFFQMMSLTFTHDHLLLTMPSLMSLSARHQTKIDTIHQLILIIKSIRRYR